jgi:hypothetical protein
MLTLLFLFLIAEISFSVPANDNVEFVFAMEHRIGFLLGLEEDYNRGIFPDKFLAESRRNVI